MVIILRVLDLDRLWIEDENEGDLVSSKIGYE